ncbi:AraC family transcriptional regulator [Pseudoteredinibacter isoporae]|uniref:AraC-like DNA-binding protein n=1 Tax=Pseudoteredinibacter isoporae TaxID=570281 RepID=A0A7X0MYB4_9GAMM|nr:AraC family transcriptional regulator [Pseudoteredinibacter isoporae]MBB6521837.1 AraC-like DNA-binding protein [Pseudoteredinibacter isoporae]NHO87381.1 AraC family transcriptional regulator [Pseudoteredinibacter isoporae]NIB23205.1 AraC family transcriptional regulator [Pseudoteredinibacter isoporae]
MKTQIPEIHTAWLIRYLLNIPLDSEAIASAARLPVDTDLEQVNRIAFVDYVHLLSWAAERLGRPNLGLELSSYMSPGDWGPVSQAAYHFATMRETLRAIQRFHPLVTQCVRIAFDESPRVGRLSCDVTLPMGESARQDVELTLGFLVAGAREAIGNDWKPLEVTFTHPKPDNTDLHQEIFACNVIFDHADNSILYHSDDLDIEIAGRDPLSRRRFTTQLENLMDNVLREETILAHTHFYINAMLGTEHCQAEEVARLMNMSRRTLTRHLGNMGTGFREIKEEILTANAKRLLSEQRWNTTAIALELGFADATAFSRSFKNATRLTPGQYRQQAQAQQRS